MEVNMNLRRWLGFLAICVVFAACTSRVIIPDATVFDGETGGCGSCFVYRLNRSKTFAITASIDEAALASADAQVTIPINSTTTIARVNIHQYGSLARATYCDCVAGDSPIEDWAAIAGEIVLERSHEPPPPGSSNATHRVSLTLKNLQFKNQRTGQRISLGEVQIRDVWVGWFVG